MRVRAGLVMLSIAVLLPTGAAAAQTHARLYRTADAGRMSAVGVGPAAPAAAVLLSHGARLIPRPHAGQTSTAAPAAPSNGLRGASGPLLANFNGVSSLDSENTNFGQEFEPPDQGLCVGNGFVVEMVNSAYTVYKPDGTVVTGPFNVNGPFDEGLIEFTSDPRCYYDPATKRWFAAILFISSSSTKSHLDVAVSNTSDPTKLWTDYQIDTTDTGGPGCPCFGDQPTLGIDAFNLYVTTNEFSILGPQFNGAQIYAISKHDLVTRATAPHFVHFGHLSIGGAAASSIQPALTSPPAGAEFFLNSLDPNGTGDKRIGVWAITNQSVVGTGGTPTLSSIVLASEAYGVPPNAQQQGTTSRLTADDDRMQQTQFTAGHIWGELDTNIKPSGDTTVRAGAAWFEVAPKLTSGKVTGATMTKQGYVAVTGNYLLYPSLQVATTGQAAMGVTLSGATRFPSAAYTILAPGASAFGPVTVSAPGITNYDPKATRWGDYSWAVVDPSGAGIWLANEYVPPASSQTTDGKRDWGTRVVEVPAGP